MKKHYLLLVLLLSIFSLQTSASNFVTSVPIANPTASSTSICEGNTLTLSANPSGGVAPYTFSWTGPNGYVSTTENPVIPNVNLLNAGVYSLVVTDNVGATSTLQSTSFVTVNAKINPTFDATLPAICKGGITPILSTTSTNGITGTWNPAVVDNNITTTYTFTPNAGQCANSLSFTIIVLNNVPPTFTLPTSVCQGGTPPVLSTISNNGIVGTWSPSTISNTTAGSYTFTPSAGQCATSKIITISINPLTATFLPAINPICSGDFLANLPTTSSNGVIGTWSPAINNTATTTYTFTPISGQCSNSTTSMTIVVNPKITPTFNAIQPICANTTAPVLPGTSNNGFTGTWNPATVSNSASNTYTFTPTAGQCATTTTLNVVVNPNILPTFNVIPPICVNGTAPVLPSTSNNGFTGTWSPTTVSNTASGTYTFTPTAGQCATTASVNVVVNPNILPTFNPIPNVCFGSTSPILPTTSTNGITGTWNPAIVNNTNSGTYTFTPVAGSCATTATLTINVNTITPSFTAILPICTNTTAPLLPSTSTNGISGSWNPAIVSNTATGIYVFTPNSGQCATTASLTITVNPIITPSFTVISQLCSGVASPVLPLTSNNSITGTWNPATISNSVSESYTFTPTAGQCAVGTTLNVTVNPNVTPTFTAIAPICSGSTRPILPSISNNSITGTWNPSVVNNTSSGTYAFTPTTGQCGLTTNLTVTVYQSPTDINLKTTDITNNSPDGIIEILSILNGVAPFQYGLNNGSFSTNTLYSNLIPGDYTITVKDSNGCEFKKIATINTICIYPNAITPNNDTHNDTFDLKGCNIIKLELFNRYGRKVNSYTNYTDQWDGTTSSGEALPDGTYYYVAEIKGGTSKSGWVFITR